MMNLKTKTKARLAGATVGAAAIAGVALGTPAQAMVPANVPVETAPQQVAHLAPEQPVQPADQAPVGEHVKSMYNYGGGAMRYGAVESPEMYNPINDSISQSYTNGYFYYTPEHGAHFVNKDSAVGSAYLAAGQQAVANGTQFTYGAPVASESCDVGTGTTVQHCVQSFENVTIDWNQGTGVQVSQNR